MACGKVAGLLDKWLVVMDASQVCALAISLHHDDNNCASLAGLGRDIQACTSLAS